VVLALKTFYTAAGTNSQPNGDGNSITNTDEYTDEYTDANANTPTSGRGFYP